MEEEAGFFVHLKYAVLHREEVCPAFIPAVEDFGKAAAAGGEDAEAGGRRGCFPCPEIEISFFLKLQGWKGAVG